MYKLAQHNKIIKSIFTLGSKKVKHSIIISIALLVSILINLPRLLSLYDVLGEPTKSFASASVKDIIVRFIFLSIFSWVVLQFNTNWKYYLYNISKVTKIIITVLCNIIWFFVATEAFQYGYEILTSSDMNKSESAIFYFVYFVVLLILVFISGILRYQIIHQQDLVEKELLKQQSLQNELMALKNQINPHFLFNSLNSLNSLVRGNKPATTFVNNLSFMYRYILQSASQDMVTLSEELKFLDSYIYLITTRYRDRFSIDIEIKESMMQEKIPALALQLLVENAVKHNEISQINPLNVKIYTEMHNIIVENVLRPRTTFVESTGHGLANLDKRYIMLKKKHIVLSNSNNIFKVKLPLD